MSLTPLGPLFAYGLMALLVVVWYLSQLSQMDALPLGAAEHAGFDADVDDEGFGAVSFPMMQRFALLFVLKCAELY
jgi:hypothetical protein